ncbi:hypothetical protein XENOCAPTIV_002668 [Xenoophorus captivus]|uniref:Trafficking protein, kinesin binding 2 n=1 Tax=Xenoophorus captivus TaxID=1517983 RepID=A0ABV0QH84_9TELE
MINMSAWFPDEGLGSSGRHHTSGSLGSCSAGSGSLYLSDSQDWVVSPSCSPDEGPTQINSISPLLAEETLRYMILSADRVEQMTKTYNDIEVVSHLLAEVGLQHELTKKDELLRIVAIASEEGEQDSNATTPQNQLQLLGGAAATALLKRDTVTYEEKEQQLVSDCVEREKKLQTLSGADGEGSGCSSPMGSVLSSFSNLSDLTVSSTVFKTFLPEKLQIVKPMEGSLTLHHWQQLAKPHLATILDPHPGVVTKGFRPLAQDAVFQLADMEEDEEGEEHRGIPVLEKGTTEKGKEELDEEEEEGGITFNVRCSSTPEERNHSVAPHTNAPLPSSRLTSSGVPSTSSCVHSDLCLTLNEVTGKLNQSPHLIPGASTSAVQSQSRTSTSTSSSFGTVTHFLDSGFVFFSSQSSLSANTPSSMRTGPSTPVTPCRLSLGDSFPHQRPPAPPSSLAKLVLERGISAQVSTDAPSSSSRCAPRQPLLQLVASTPANSPSQSPVHSPVPTESRQHPPDNFLASRPAELFLQDVYGLNLGRAPHPDLPSPSQETTTLSSGSKPVRDKANLVSVGLVERLRHLGFSKVLHSSESDAPVPHQEAATFVSAGGGSLMEGLRRNQSLPAMIGARVGTKSTAHPTSLAIPPSPWGNLKERRPHLASISHPQRGSKH